MKKKLLYLLAVLLIAAGFYGLFYIINIVRPKGRGALQITSNIRATAYLDNKSIGSTPLCKCDASQTIEEGLYTLRLVPEDSSTQVYTAKVKISPNVLTAVEHTFLPGGYASSYILLLEKVNSRDAQIFVTSLPGGALVSVDGTAAGVTPLLQKSISPSEHEIEIEKGGFSKKTIRVRTVLGYKLIIQASLGASPQDNQALPGSNLLTPSVSPTPTLGKPTVKILSTPTGFLRVRDAASLTGAEIGQVNPGETYPMLDDTGTWIKIQLKDGKVGYVSATYVEKITQ